MKLFRTTLLTALSLFLASALPAEAASTVPTWQPAKTIALPSNGTSVPSGYLPALSCASSGNCVAGGSYSDASGDVLGLVVPESNGVWKTGIELTAPSGSASNPNMSVFSLSCPTATSCVAVGSYQDTAGNTDSFVASESNGSWPIATKVALPGNAAPSGNSSSTLHFIACTSAGNCTALGTYLDGATPIEHSLGYVMSEVGGTWKTAQQIALPANANVNPFVSASQASCSSVGNCALVGSYVDNNGNTHGLLINEVGGVFAPGTAVTLPGNASAYAGSSLSEVTCVSPGNCTALGTYNTNTGAIQGLTVTEIGGVWGRAIQMQMPNGAATNPHVLFYGFGGISCPSVGNCAAGGQYRDTSNHYQGFLLNEVNGKWKPSTELSLPSGSQFAGKNGGVVAVACVANGTCSAGAAYVDSAGNYQAGVVSEVGNVWQTATKIALPSGATTVGVDGGVYGLTCASDGTCTATGSYASNATQYQGFSTSAK